MAGVPAVADPGAYAHQVRIHPGKGHWMDREDAMALPWMAARERYLEACALVSVDTMLARLVRVVEDSDIVAPVLARAYRKVASFYRFALVGERQLECAAARTARPEEGSVDVEQDQLGTHHGPF